MPAAAQGDDDLARLIAQSAADLNLPVSPTQVGQLLAHVRLIARWNATYNLTAVRDPARMVTHHVVDCLAATAALHRRRNPVEPLRLLDVGSGAGLPGLIIAVTSPRWTITCADTVGKKVAFLRQAIGQLALENAAAVHQRVESLHVPAFDVVASRAFASLADFVALTRPLVGTSGEWMAMKGRPPLAEIADLNGITFHVEPLTVPGLHEDRCLVWMRQK